MQKTILLVITAFLIITSSHSWASEERPEHFEGRASADWAEALKNLDSANAELKNLIMQDELTIQESARIHELSYTMENALQKMRAQIVETESVLESLHKSSESPDLGQTRRLAKTYLDLVNELE